MERHLASRGCVNQILPGRKPLFVPPHHSKVTVLGNPLVSPNDIFLLGALVSPSSSSLAISLINSYHILSNDMQIHIFDNIIYLY